MPEGSGGFLDKVFPWRKKTETQTHASSSETNTAPSMPREQAEALAEQLRLAREQQARSSLSDRDPSNATRTRTLESQLREGGWTFNMGTNGLEAIKPKPPTPDVTQKTIDAMTQAAHQIAEPVSDTSRVLRRETTTQPPTPPKAQG